MKTLVFTLGLLMASSVATAEHGPGNGDGGRADHRTHMQQTLGLSSEQVEQMDEIREQGGSRQDMRSVLTEEQRAKASDMRQQHEGQFEKRLSHMQQNLNLSEDQIAQIRDIRAGGGSREDIHAILTEEQQARAREMRDKRHGDRNAI